MRENAQTPAWDDAAKRLWPRLQIGAGATAVLRFPLLTGDRHEPQSGETVLPSLVVEEVIGVIVIARLVIAEVDVR